MNVIISVRWMTNTVAYFNVEAITVANFFDIVQFPDPSSAKKKLTVKINDFLSFVS